MNELSQIELIRSQILNNIAEITASPKPDYTLDGQSVSWSEYLNQLQKTLDWCNERISQLDPVVIHSQGTT
ncbi:MAG: hypothetical protein Q4C47_00725 [Planctomycetia bacterium]|nr:hypothetical protein [Planctomycetia bacterium]